MATFYYQGTDVAGRRVKGLVSADNARNARDQLRNQGLRIKKVTERPSSTTSASWLQLIQRRRFQSALTEFYRELTTLLQASVPLLDAIDSTIGQVPSGLLPTITAMRDRIAEGAGIADAMQAESWLFDEMTIGMVRVGEHAGNLDEVLDQVATFREQSAQLQDRILSAILYPAIVTVVSIGVTLFLMTVVVPMLLDNLTELGGQLPWSTRFLKWLSDLILDHGWWLALAMSAVAVAILSWSKSGTGQRRVAQLLLKIPVLGSLIRKQTIGRSVLVVACLLRSGIELVQALRIAAHSTNHPLYRDAFENVASDIEKGQGLRESVAKHAIFPASIAQVFALGQQSGQLEAMLQRLGTDYDRQSAILASRVTTIAEPLLIVMLSLVVGFIMFATVLPILEAGNMLSQ